MMNEIGPKPTKVVESVRDVSLDGIDHGGTAKTYEDLCSAELGVTAKGEPQVKSVKVYAATAQEAADRVLATFKWLSDELADYKECNT